MDILAILFLIFGWIFKVNGLVITSIVLSAIISFYQILKICFANEKSKRDIFIFGFDMVLLALSIITICLL